jgi:hypothetical protein
MHNMHANVYENQGSYNSCSENKQFFTNWMLHTFVRKAPGSNIRLLGILTCFSWFPQALKYILIASFL